jgi:hypothetical protein
MLGANGTQEAEPVDPGETELAHDGVDPFAREAAETGFTAPHDEQPPVLTPEAAGEIGSSGDDENRRFRGS